MKRIVKLQGDAESGKRDLLLSYCPSNGFGISVNCSENIIINPLRFVDAINFIMQLKTVNFGIDTKKSFEIRLKLNKNLHDQLLEVIEGQEFTEVCNKIFNDAIGRYIISEKLNMLNGTNENEKY